MSIFQNIIYGLISGLTEFLPVSSRAHQILLRYVLGVESRNFLQEFLVHIGLLMAVVIGCRESITQIHREKKLIAGSRRKRRNSLDYRSYYDLRLLRTASFPLIIGLFLSITTDKMESNLLTVMAFLLINAFVILLAEHSQHGNRDSRTMTALDGFVMGILCSLSVLPGISRTGMICSYATMRGADSRNVVNWAILLGIPAILFFICLDIYGLVTVGTGLISFSVIGGYLLAGISAFIGGYISVSVFLTMINYAGYSQFAYYSVGVALITFLLYLIT